MIEKRSIDELLELAKLEEVVAHFVPLSSRGANRKAESCPFCGSKKKFNVAPAKQLYKCFECGEGGSGALKYLMHTAGNKSGMKYIDAVKWLADFYKFILQEEPREADADNGDGFDKSYFIQRMQAIRYQERPEGKGVFRARTDGGIEIRYPHLYPDGPAWQQHKGNDFVRIRLHPARVTAKGKYEQPADSGIRIFIPPVVVDAWRRGVKWRTLFITEGEFKAYSCATEEVPVVGIGGIQLFIEKKGSHNLHPDLVQLLKNAQSVCMLHDADAISLKWNPDTEPNKDLGKRLRDFARSVTGFRRSVGSLVPNVVYATINPALIDTAKGLDDLAEREGVERTVDRLSSLRSSDLFEFYNITKEEWHGINNIFGLKMRGGVPQKFYNQFSSIIGSREFVFCGGKYQWTPPADDESEGRLVMVEHPDSKLFVSVACEWYKKLHKPDENGNPQPYLKPWKETDLKRNYVNRGVPKFLDTIEAFDDFIVEPGHHEDYKPVLVVGQDEFGPRTKLLNKYHPLTVEPKQGTYPNITKFLQHIFGTHTLKTIDDAGNVLAESEAWVVYLDRWTVMYRHPRERVPAVVLASEKRKTGKSTLLFLNLAMWGSNAVVIGNNAITDNFNADWIDCSYVGVDETSIDKKQDGEKLKAIMTSPVSQRRGMYKDREKSINHTKFDFTTNDPDRFLSISEDEMRYWVIEVPAFQEEDRDLRKKMIAELPALFWDLRHRKIVHPPVSRMWFADSVIDNAARRAVAAQSKSWVEKELELWIQEQFYTYQWPELYFKISDIRKGVNDQNGARFQNHAIKEVLEKRFKAHKEFCWVTVPQVPEKRKGQGQSPGEVGKYEKNHWWILRAPDFLPANEAKELLDSARLEWSVSASSIDGAGNRDEMKLHHPAWRKELNK